MAKKLGVTEHKMLWVMARERLAADPNHHKAIKIGGTTHKRYSDICLKKLASLLDDARVHEAYANRRAA
jgi:hypothetical protein